MIHTLRSVSSLNGLWDFSYLGPIDITSFNVKANFTTEKMPVPSAFDALPAYAGCRGAAIYRTHLSIPVGRKALLKFGAVSMWTQIYIDGKCLFEHACGYSPFSVEIPAESFADRELTVLVDNRFDFDRVPMHLNYFDFYQYGGIIREVSLHVLPIEDFWIDAVQVIPTADYSSGKCEAIIFLNGKIPSELKLKFNFDKKDTSSQEILVTQNVVRTELQVPNPHVWSTQAPHLHSLRVTLCNKSGDELDDATTSFGLRKIEARNGALWLNGEKLVLRGYNRHEWHPNTGPCTSVVQMVADLQFLKDLGCNFIRGSHYPQDQRFLDICDAMGFLVWEENLGWGQHDNTFNSKKFRQDHLLSLCSMVRESWNHPSVIIWGFLNEAWSNKDYVRPIFEETVSTLRSMDPSRLVSFASMCVLDDKQYDLVDLISINIYPGWYGAEVSDNPLSLIRPQIDKWFKHLDTLGWQNKPIIISEIGAEGLYGWHDLHDDFFTEEYQAAYLKEACLGALNHPRCSGIALWHFSDIRTYGGGLSLIRPRTFNNKGTLDEYRRPKAAYKVVQEIFKSFQ